VYTWALHAQALVDAHLGRVSAAREAAEEGLRVARVSGAVAPLTQLTATLGFLELSLGDPVAAHGQLGPLAELIASVGVAEPGVVRFMPNAIEALIGLGEFEEASRLLAPFDERARSLDRVSARAAAARCRATLAAAHGEFGDARSSLEDAFAQHARLEEPFELGRTLLAQGSIERRARRRADARAALTRALELFDSLGAALWSERTAAELARIPGRTAASGELSETERRVAELVRLGLANKEIAARLYVTVRTVEAHLSKAYAKLGVRSRVELAARIGGGERTPGRT
jgi:DNA-binding CsgD family transcriptional regulator